MGSDKTSIPETITFAWPEDASVMIENTLSLNSPLNIKGSGTGTPAGDSVRVHGGSVSVDDGGSSLTVDGSVSITGTPTVIANVGTGTQPVSGSVSVSNFPSVQAINDNGGSLTVDGTVAVSNFPSTQTVAGTVSVLNFPATQAVSGTISVGNFPATQPTTLPDASLWVTATAASGSAVTLTLPAVASQFHRINFIEITAYTTAARTGSATPLTVTTTNLPGSPAFTFQTAAAVGTKEPYVLAPGFPIKSSVANTATTIVCPATTSVIWRVNVSYYTSS